MFGLLLAALTLALERGWAGRPEHWADASRSDQATTDDHDARDRRERKHRGAQPPAQRTLGVAVLDVFRGLSAERPLLVAIDDEQWLDRSSAAVLAFALRRLQGEPVGSLSTRRGDVAPSDDTGRGVPAHDAHRLPLGPLDLDAIDTMIEERLPGAAPPPPPPHPC